MTKIQLLLMFLLFCFTSCGGNNETSSHEHTTWAEKLGFQKGERVLILHADDMGMVQEANDATIFLLENEFIQSASAMPACPAYEEAIQWAIENPQYDVGMHLTLTSEWRRYRWGPVADPSEVPGLVDPDGYLWPRVPDVVMNASPQEVETELRAQIDKTLDMGFQPTHMDTHMGTVFGSPEFTKVYLDLAEEYNIPAMIIDLSNSDLVDEYREAGFPLTDRLLQIIDDYSLPKLDYFGSVPKADSYEELREKFFEQIRSLKPGLTEIIFHPQYATEFSKTISGQWQQRAWEVELFADPVVQEFLRDEGIVFTNWREIMERFERI